MRITKKEFATLLARIENNDPSLTTVDLTDNQIGDVGAQAVAKVLEKNCTVTEVILQNNQIGAVGSQALAAALEKNRTVKRVDLTNNQIGDAGAQAVAKVLEKNCTVNNIILGSNQIGDAGAQELATAVEKNRTVKGIYLAGNQIGDAGSQALAAALEKNQVVNSVYLNSNQIGAAGAKALAVALEKNLTVIIVDLENNQIGDEMKHAINSIITRNRAIRRGSQKATATSTAAISGSSTTQTQTPSKTEFATPSQDSFKTKVAIKSGVENGDFVTKQVPHQTQTQIPQISLAEFQAHQSQTQAALAQSLQTIQSTQAIEQKFTQQLAAIHQAYSSSAQRLERIDAEQIRISQLPVAQVSADNLTVDPKFKLSPEAIAEKFHIANNPSLKSYRDKVEKTFNEVFLTAAMMSVGEFSAKSSTPAEMIRTFSNFSSGLPFAPIILSCAAAATDGVLQARKEGRLLNVAELNPTSNTMDAAFFSEEIARRFTITNEAKINSLAQGKNTQELRGISGFLESAKKFAQDQMTNLDPATARGLFGEAQSPVQLLAYKDSQAAVEYVLNGELKNKSGADAMVAEIVEAVTGMKAKSLVPAIPVVASETNQGKQSGQLRKRIIAQKPNATLPIVVKKLPVAVELPTPPAPNPIVKGASNLHSGEEIERRFNEMREFHAQQIANLSQSNSQKLSQMQEQSEKQARDFREENKRREAELKKEIARLSKENEEARKDAKDARKDAKDSKKESAETKMMMNSVFQTNLVGEGDKVRSVVSTRKGVEIRVVNPEAEERISQLYQEFESYKEESNDRHDRSESRGESHAEKWKRKEDKKKNSLSGRISGMLK